MPTSGNMDKQDDFERGKLYKAQLRKKILIDFTVTTLVLWALGLFVFLCLFLYFV